MNPCLNKLTYVFVVALLCCSSVVAVAQEEGQPAADPDPIEILQQMTDFMKIQDQFELIADIYDDELSEADNEEYLLNQQSMISVDRPGRFRIDMFINDEAHRDIIYNGSTLTLLAHKEKLYSVIDAADTIDATLDYAINELGITAPLADFLYHKADESFMQNIGSSQYGGKESVNDYSCHHLKFEQDSVDWQIWVEEGDQPVPRKLLIKYKSREGEPEYVIEFMRWEFGIEFNTDEFEFVAEDGMEQIDYITNSDANSEGEG